MAVCIWRDHFGGPVLEYTVKRGADIGLVLIPHRCRNEKFLASKHKFGPHAWALNEEELKRLMDRGYSIRMSPKDERHRRGASLIAPGSIQRS
jgi:hypothetical protein